MLDDVMSERIPRQITLLLRMKMKENTIHTGKYFVYGMDSKIVNEKLKEFRKKSYIDKLGVHFHRKTQNVSEWNIVDELNDSVDDFDLIDIVNIGGGLPVKYKNTSDFSIDAIFDKINNLNTFLKSKNIQLMIEPGRFISGPSVILETSVINVFDKNIILNASVYNSSPDIIVYSIKLLVDKENDSDESGTEYLLKGNTACSMDIFRYKVKFSTSPKVGDKIIFLNAGAYNYCTDFMSLKRLDTVIID
jgi:ornithine decarboxylase